MKQLVDDERKEQVDHHRSSVPISELHNIGMVTQNVASNNDQNGRKIKRSKSSSKATINYKKRFITMLLNLGIIVTLFVALTQIFDPTLDEHVHIIQDKNQPVSFLFESQNNHPFAVLPKKKRRHRQQIHAKRALDRLKNTKNRQMKQSLQEDRVLQLLDEAGVDLTSLNSTQLKQLPKWDNIESLYGDSVTIDGMEELCSTYRSKVAPDDRILAVAGMFNTGTNYLEALLNYNIKDMQQDILWQVPWGKHRMAYVKYNHTAPEMDEYNKDNVLPIVVIRDPYAWMQSMCKSPYAAIWKHRKFHCPNLIYSKVDHHRYNQLPQFSNPDIPSFEVTVDFDDTTYENSVKFDSLADLWSQWYKLYFDATYPRLIVRYEDLVFQPAKVLKEIATCVDAKVRPRLIFQLNTSKQHGSGTDFLKAISKTANAKVRLFNMTEEDFDFATKHLDSNLMTLFQYKHPHELEEPIN